MKPIFYLPTHAPMQAEVHFMEAQAAVAALKRRSQEVVPPTAPAPPEVLAWRPCAIPCNPMQPHAPHILLLVRVSVSCPMYLIVMQAVGR